MSSFAEMFESPARRRQPVRAMLGLVAEAPAAPEDELYVTIDSFDGGASLWGPCRWSPGTALPERGDEVLVVFDEHEQPWVVTDAPVAGGGIGTGDLNYVHTQGSPSASWTVTHGLGKYPAVEVVDSGESVIIPNVRYLDANSVLLTFGSPTSGKAVFN